MEVSCLETISVHGVLSRQFSKLYFYKITYLPTKVVYFSVWTGGRFRNCGWCMCLINKRDHAYTDRSERTLLSQRVKEKSKGASSLTGYIFNRNTSRRGRSINRITRSMCPILTFFAVSTSETDFAIATITSRQINALSTVLAWFVKTFVYVCTNHKDKVSC